MTTDTERLLEDARAGDAAALGGLLERYRNYLRLLARVEVGRRLQGKVDASDVVQEAFLDAHRYFPAFRGSAEAQLVAWLREILAGRIAHTVRHYLGTQARDARLERRISADIDRSSAYLEGGLVAGGSSPSERVARHEQGVALADALAKLPDDYRDVIVLRNLEGLTLTQVAVRMGKTEDSVQKLWMRGLARLKGLLPGTSHE